MPGNSPVKFVFVRFVGFDRFVQKKINHYENWKTQFFRGLRVISYSNFTRGRVMRARAQYNRYGDHYLPHWAAAIALVRWMARYRRISFSVLNRGLAKTRHPPARQCQRLSPNGCMAVNTRRRAQLARTRSGNRQSMRRPPPTRPNRRRRGKTRRQRKVSALDGDRGGKTWGQWIDAREECQTVSERRSGAQESRNRQYPDDGAALRLVYESDFTQRPPR